MAIAGGVGIGISLLLRLEWWQSGLLTPGLMIAADVVWELTWRSDFDVPIAAVVRGFLPVMVYVLGMGWLVLQPSSLTNTAIGVGIVLVPTLWILWEMETGADEVSHA